MFGCGVIILYKFQKILSTTTTLFSTTFIIKVRFYCDTSEHFVPGLKSAEELVLLETPHA